MDATKIQEIVLIASKSGTLSERQVRVDDNMAAKRGYKMADYAQLFHGYIINKIFHVNPTSAFQANRLHRTGIHNAMTN